MPERGAEKKWRRGLREASGGAEVEGDMKECNGEVEEPAVLEEPTNVAGIAPCFLSWFL